MSIIFDGKFQGWKHPIEQFNKIENRNGQIIKLILVTQSGSRGISLKNICK